MSQLSDSARAMWDRLADWAWPGHPTRWRDVPSRLRPTVFNVSRLTIAAVVSYLITLLTTDGAIDLTGPLTALLVVQASAYSTVKMGVVRVGAVLAGVLIATVLSNWIGLTWWSLGAAIAASLLAGKVLRLGDQALETPISAMLILGVANHDVASEVRILNTFIGAGVGIALSLIYPPAVPTAQAKTAFRRVVDAAAAPLDQAGDVLDEGGVDRGLIEEWIDRTRSANREVADATRAIAHLRDSRRLNARAVGTADVVPILATGLDALERCLLAIRALFTVLLSEVPDRGDDSTESTPDALADDEDIRKVIAVVLHDVAGCLRAFGDLVVAEAAESDAHGPRVMTALTDNLEMLRETRAILTDLIMVKSTHDDRSWLMRGSIVAAIEQIFAQLDLERRESQYQRWRTDQQRVARIPVMLQNVLPHPDRPIPRGLEAYGERRRARQESDAKLIWPEDEA